MCKAREANGILTAFEFNLPLWPTLFVVMKLGCEINTGGEIKICSEINDVCRRK